MILDCRLSFNTLNSISVFSLTQSLTHMHVYSTILMGHGSARGPQTSRSFTIYYGISGKELEHCMTISPMMPFLSSSQYVYWLNRLTS